MNNQAPPKIPHRFFRWYCHKDYMEDIEGDLLEKFERKVEEKGIRTAKSSFTKDVIRLCRPGLIRPLFKSQGLNKVFMLKNNFKLGFRNLVKRKEYAIINTMGLAIGLASAMLIFLYVQNEFSYDKSFPNADKIFKMVQKISGPEETKLYPVVPYSLVNIMQNDYAEIEQGTGVSGPYDSQVVTIKDENDQQVSFVENSALLADSNFLSVFQYKMIQGNAKTALTKPHSVVLTKSTAKRFFGDTNPLGQFIAPSGKNSIVTGVCEDPPANSHIQFSYLISSGSVDWLSREKFNLASAHCYFKLLDNVDAQSLESKLTHLIDKYVLKEIERTKNISRQDYQKAGNAHEYFLKPLTSLHLNEENLGGFQTGGNLTTVRILIVIAILILVIACINFMNLATARATERSKEVGVRKVMGSLKSELIFQFLIESFIISLLSTILGVLIAVLALPYFNSLTNNHLELYFDLRTIGIFTAITLMISLLAGTYPAFILSSFNPITALKGGALPTSNGSMLKNGLVSFQFFIAIVLIITTLIIDKQVTHTREKALGFDKEQLIVIEGIAHKQSDLFYPYLNEVRSLPQVKNAAGSLWVQGFSRTITDIYRVAGDSKDYPLRRVLVGDKFAETVNFELVEGEFFSEATNDSMAVILNETAVKEMGLKEPIGQLVILSENISGEMKEYQFVVKGVIKDFHYNTLHQPIEPLIIQSNENIYGRMRFIVAKLEKNSNVNTIELLESKWNEMFPDRPFTFRFLDDTLNAKYQKEQQTAKILTVFSFLTIFIACMGLFALSSYTTSLRIKEIGIRKVLGASVRNIVLLLSADFSKLLILTFLFAIPAGWYIGSVWLSDFAYRISIGPEVFILSGVIILLVTSTTVSFQTLKASNTNPVDSLRNE